MECPKCGKDISKNLDTCPYCQDDLNTQETTVILNKKLLKQDLNKTILLNRAIKEEYTKEEKCVSNKNFKYRKESQDINVVQIVISIAIGIVIIILIVLGYFALKK